MLAEGRLPGGGSRELVGLSGGSTLLPLCFFMYDLMTHGVSHDLLWPTASRLSLTRHSRPCLVRPRHSFVISLPLDHSFCCTQSAFLRVSRTYHPLNWHQAFSPILLLAQDGHQAPFKGLPESHTTRPHLSKQPQDQVFLWTATTPHHSPLALTICLFFKATEKELGGRKVRISLRKPGDPPPLRSGCTDSLCYSLHHASCRPHT